YLAANFCPGKTGCQADFALRGNALLAELDWPEHLLNALCANQIFEIRSDAFAHEFARNLATARSDLSLEVAYARFTRVVTNDFQQAFIGEFELVNSQAI